MPENLGFYCLTGVDEQITAECAGLEARNAWYTDGFEAIADQHTEHDFESSQYFYHPDHLGSSSFITNASGDVDQHLQYLPFGEPWIDQRTQNNIRFTFSGKERDEETGYNYFGARYYNADISIWLSVDPLSDQAPGWTPYRYGFNNPIKYTDPTGMFETKAEAQNWAKEKNYKTGWLFGSHKISQDSDGSWGVYDKKNEVAHYRNSGSPSDIMGLSENGIISITSPYEKGISDLSTGLSVFNSYASATAKFMESTFIHESKHIYNYAQKIGGKLYSASELTKQYAQEASRLANNYKGIGKFLGITGAALSWEEYSSDRTTGNLLKAITNTILVIPRMNPLIGVGLGVLELSGVTNKAFDSLGDAVDNQLIK